MSECAKWGPTAADGKGDGVVHRRTVGPIDNKTWITGHMTTSEDLQLGLLAPAFRPLIILLVHGHTVFSDWTKLCVIYTYITITIKI